VQKVKPKPFIASSHTVVNVPKVSSAQPTPKPQSIDESYSAFMDDMKALGAFDGDFP
jgi:WW domain-binding protein 11